MAEVEVAPKQKKKATCLAIIIVALGLGFIFVGPILNVAWDLKKGGFLDNPAQKEYHATSMGNLKAQYQAMQLYYDSEGMMPEASGWMDAAKTYVRTADLKKGEELKKFVNPRYPSKDGVFGYAFDVRLSEVYLDQIEDLTIMPLTFESKATDWNAFGKPGEIQPNPELPGGNQVVTAGGSATTLDKLPKTRNE